MSPAFVVLEEVIKALKNNGTKQLKAFSTDTPDREKDWLVNGNYVFFEQCLRPKGVYGYCRVQVKEDIFKNLITQQLQELDLSQTRCPWTYEISAEIYNLLDIAAFKCPTVNICSLSKIF